MIKYSGYSKLFKSKLRLALICIANSRANTKKEKHNQYAKERK